MTSAANVASAILDQLAAWGVRQIYGVAGDDIFYLLDALARQRKISFYRVRHEESAALMASAQAKLTGGLGVCLADGGPGSLHLLNGLADAWADKVPVLAVTGQVARRDIGTNTKQYIDQQSLFRPLAAYTGQLSEPAATCRVLESALRAAVGSRSVAHVSVPMDVLSLPWAAGAVPYPPYLGAGPLSSTEVVAGAVEMMDRSRRPVILAGGGAREAGPLVAQLALKWGAAIITTLAGTGAVDQKNPLYAGGLGHAGSPASSAILSRADLCLVVGANWWPPKYVPENIPIIQLDRAPVNIGATTPASYGLAGEAGVLLKQILGSIGGSPDQGWLEEIKKEISAWHSNLEAESSTPGSPAHPAALVRAIQRTVADDAIICLDTGDHTVWFGRAFRPQRQRVLVSGKWRTMGFALPAAIAAKICRPGSQVLALAGDGGFAMTMAEFITAVRYNLAVTVLVVNNGSLAMEKNKMEAGGLIPEGTRLNNPDFAGFAESCGGLGLRAADPRELEGLISRALNSGRPALLDVQTAAVPVPGTVMPS